MKKRVAIVGVGALGTAVLPLIAAREDVHITLIDGDKVEGPELGRQLLYRPTDKGSFKVQVCAERAAENQWQAQLTPFPEFLDPRNALTLLQRHDVILDLCDDAHARALVDDSCAKLNIPLVSGSVHAMQGQVFVLHQGKTMGLKDLFKGRVGSLQDGCDMRDVPLSLITMMAALIALRTGQVLGGDQTHEGTIDLLDMKNERWSRFHVPAQQNNDDLIAEAT